MTRVGAHPEGSEPHNLPGVASPMSTDPTLRPRSRPLRAVFLDAGNTLIFADRLRILELYHAEGVASDEDRIVRAELQARAQLAARVEEGAVGTEPHLWREYFMTLFRLSGVPEEALAGVGRRLRETHERDHLWTHVDPGTGEALEALLDHGYRLAVISNADGRMEAVLKRTGLTRFLEFVMDSEVVGVAKPDPAIFRAGLERMGVPAEEALYVGDLFPVDVVGAWGAGMEAVLLDPSRALEYPVVSIPSVLELPTWLREGRSDEEVPTEATGGGEPAGG
jgi:putative hydrolase of the HAD superfamily